MKDKMKDNMKDKLYRLVGRILIHKAKKEVIKKVDAKAKSLNEKFAAKNRAKAK